MQSAKSDGGGRVECLLELYGELVGGGLLELYGLQVRGRGHSPHSLRQDNILMG